MISTRRTLSLALGAALTLGAAIVLAGAAGCLPGQGHLVFLGGTEESTEWSFDLPGAPIAYRLNYQITDHTFLTQEDTSRFRLYGFVDPDGPEGEEDPQEEVVSEILVGGCSEGCWVETLDAAESLPGPHRFEWWLSPSDSSGASMANIRLEFFFGEPTPPEEPPEEPTA